MPVKESLSTCCDRRTMLVGASSLVFFMLPSALTGPASRAAESFFSFHPEGGPGRESKEDISPLEDLMREHGILERILLIYEEIHARLGSGQKCSPDVLGTAAEIVSSFIENYHEKLEEEHIFPRFKKAGSYTELVTVLREQHEAGRLLTGKIRNGAAQKVLDPEKLMNPLRLFIHMYRPHKSREDTVLFPAFRTLVSPGEYDRLGDAFEEKEHALFGEKGFEKIVEKVADCEKQLGIYDLKRFTPRQ